VNSADPASSRPDPRDLRCSDRDREAVSQALRAALEAGRIDLDELTERLDRTYAARTYRELDAVVADLPGAATLQPTVAAAPPAASQAGHPVERVGGQATSGSAVAVMGGATRSGRWTVPPTFSAVAVMGGVKLDLRQARFEESQTTITAVAFWGGIEIIAPDDIAVNVDGVGVMGGFDGPHDSDPAAVAAVRVTGLALMGGVEVKRRPLA
jgi:hypothetical protein